MIKTLEQNLKEKTAGASWQPVFFDLTSKKDQKKVSDLLAQGKIQQVSDDYEEECRELFAFRNPSVVYSPNFATSFKTYFEDLQKKAPLWQQGKWVYFPWLSKISHILEEEDFFTVRTSRNKNLITKEEQDKFYNATVGIGGLSVGSAIAIALTLQGGPKHMKLADFDRLALSNTNRIRAGVDSLGDLKVQVVARQIYEINPYAEIELFTDGISKENIEEFFVGKRKIDVVLDEMDNLAIKYLFREMAQKHRVPIVMAADNDNSGVVDIERYDLDKNTPFFHNRIPNASYEKLSKLDKFGIGRTIAGHVGLENHTEKMLGSLQAMGKTIVSWPQLGGTAMLNAAAVSYCVRRILNGQPLENNRAIVSLDELFIPNYKSKEEQVKRDKVAATFKKAFGL